MHKWIIAVMASLAAGMEILDASVVNITLAHMRGGLSAGVDEVAWVLTGYLVANAVMIPMTGWLASHFGRKRFFIFCTILFATCSALSGMAPNLFVLIFLRIFQGLGGGALTATGQAIVVETFPPAQRGIAMALWSAGSIGGSISGPIMGGYIADHFSWRLVFFINVPIAAIVVMLALIFLRDPPYLRKKVEKIDVLGFLFLIMWVGCLQIILGRGQRLDWFNSSWITALTIIAVPAFIGFVIRELLVKEPVVDLRVLKNPTFAIGTMLMAIQMFGFFGSIVLIALFAQTIMDYTALQAGIVVASGAMTSVIAMPLAGRLLSVVDPRLLIGTGALVSGLGMLQASYLNLTASYWQVMMPRVLLGMGLAWIWVSLNTISLSVLPKEKMGVGSGLFNLVRILGGSFGIALLTTLLSRGSQVHQTRLVANITRWDLDVQQRLETLAASFQAAGSDPFTAQQQALAALYGLVKQQAALLAFLDGFRLVAFFLFAVIPFLFLIKGKRVGEGISEEEAVDPAESEHLSDSP